MSARDLYLLGCDVLGEDIQALKVGSRVSFKSFSGKRAVGTIERLNTSGPGSATVWIRLDDGSGEDHGAADLTLLSAAASAPEDTDSETPIETETGEAPVDTNEAPTEFTDEEAAAVNEALENAEAPDLPDPDLAAAEEEMAAALAAEGAGEGDSGDEGGGFGGGDSGGGGGDSGGGGSGGGDSGGGGSIPSAPTPSPQADAAPSLAPYASPTPTSTTPTSAPSAPSPAKTIDQIRPQTLDNRFFSGPAQSKFDTAPRGPSDTDRPVLKTGGVDRRLEQEIAKHTVSVGPPPSGGSGRLEQGLTAARPTQSQRPTLTATKPQVKAASQLTQTTTKPQVNRPPPVQPQRTTRAIGKTSLTQFHTKPTAGLGKAKPLRLHGQATLDSPIEGVSDEAWTEFACAMRTAQPTAVSASNALGAWEIKPRRLADLGLMKELHRTRAPTGRMVWVGEPIAPFTIRGFLEDLPMQYRTFAESMRRYVAGLRDGSIPRPDGGRPAGMSLSGILGILHRCGPSGLKSWNDPEKQFNDTRELYDRANGVF